jgi:enoyl-CoA hydratase/carnithine racemase
MFVTYHREGNIGYVTLNRPDRKNSIGAEMAVELENAWAEFEEDADAWVAVLTGEGSTFCAGRDIKGDMTPLPRTSLGDQFVPVTDRPIIAGIRGHVIGLGWYMSSACDYIVAGTDTNFLMTQVKVGLPGPYGFAARMLMPPPLAFEVLALGRPLTAERAYNHGLVNEIVEPEDVRARATAVAESVLSLAPGQLRLTKDILRATERTVSDEVKSMYWDGRAELEDHPNTIEARAALREKRAPQFVSI